MSFFSTTVTPRSTLRSAKGFTIVELLIVIVVIAILAAITIVAYNGISNRAKAGAAQSLASQVTRKILAQAALNDGDYPATLADAGITDTKGLDYTPDNNSTPKKFGLTATSGNVSYYTTSESTSPSAGGYPGHGQNGVAAIKNLLPRPQGGVGVTWDHYYSSGTATATTGSVSGLPNNVTSAYRYQVNTAGVGGPYINVRQQFTITSPVTFSVYMRSATAVTIKLQAEQYNTPTAGVRNSPIHDGGTVTLSPNVWTRLSTTIPPVAGYPYYLFAMYTSSSVPAGTVLFASAAMLTEGSTLYDYADGSSTNWAWTGAVNASQSTGPANP